MRGVMSFGEKGQRERERERERERPERPFVGVPESGAIAQTAAVVGPFAAGRSRRDSS
jgi:hypothetical protein